MKTTSRILVVIVLSLLLAAVLVPLSAAPFTQSVNISEVRVVNALVGLGSVDVYLNGAQIAFGLEPETATPYFVVPSGKHTVSVRMSGADPLSAPVADILVDLAPNQSETAIAYQKQFAEEDGYIPPLEQSGAFMVLDDNRSPIPLGKTRLTAVHLAPGSPARLSITYPDRASLLHEISLEQPYGDIDIEAGVYPLAIVDATSTALDRLELVGEVSFYGSTHQMLIIVPDISPNLATANILPGPLSAAPRMFAISAAIDPPGEGFRMRIIHAAHNTAVVDLYIDERLIVPRLNYSRYTEYLGLSDYSHTITLRARDAAPGARPLATASLEITPDNQDQKTWTLLLLNATQQNQAALQLIDTAGDGDQAVTQPQIINTPGGPMLMTLLPDNVAQTQRNSARVRLLHAVDGALDLSVNALTVPAREPTPTPAPGPTPVPGPPVRLVDAVVFGSEASEDETLAGFYPELNFVVGGGAQISSLTDTHLIAGMVYTFVVIGRPDGQPPVEVLQIADYGRGIPKERLYLGQIVSTQPVVNIRENPNANANVRSRLPNGTNVEVLGRNFNSEWVLLRFVDPDADDVRLGWVSAALIRVTRLGDEINIVSLPLASP